MQEVIIIKARRDLASAFSKVDPVLDDDEYGFEKDTNRVKLGDGKTRWNKLPYFTGELFEVLPVCVRLKNHANN